MLGVTATNKPMMFSKPPMPGIKLHLSCATGMDVMDEFVMDRFVNEQNLERFRKLASTVTTEAERKMLLTLLAGEEAKFIELQKAGIRPKLGETAIEDI
jgi:hypothetical protein